MKPAILRLRRGTFVLTAMMLVLASTWLFFHRQIQHSLIRHVVLSSNDPNRESFADAANNATAPLEFLQRCWATGKVAQRELVASFLKDNVSARASWIGHAERLLFACSLDADASVRELGLAALDEMHSPLLCEAAAAQLRDLDPLVRRVGVDYLRKCDPKLAVPLLVGALDDPDLRNVAAAENALMRFSGQDFGVRAVQAIPSTDSGETNLARIQAIQRGVQQRKQWWRDHQNEYVVNAPSATVSAQPFEVSTRPIAPDFKLSNLEGKTVKLSDFKGKVVLVNFWATWCTACLKEIPDLIVLQKTLGDKVAIVGIALDGIPDEDGDALGEENHHGQKRLSRFELRAKVERAVKLRQINYPVLLDPAGDVGGEYNGGELPTTVLFDQEGRVRRRFIGERSTAVFEAMIAEAGRPAGSPVAKK